MSRITPLKQVIRFLRWFCREDYLEEIEGNLLELYEQQYTASPEKARRQFMWNVMRHFHLAFIKSFHLLQPANHEFFTLSVTKS
ncbi:MAG: permease prefix domain 2-containing transporter [Bacteroidota bacterium]